MARRLVLGGLVAAGSGLLAGCSELPDVDLSTLDPRSDPATPTTTEPREPADPDAEADVRTLEAAYAEVLASSALVTAVADRHPRLDATLRPLLALHRSHAEVLAGAAPDRPEASPPPTRAPRRRARALELVRSAEATTQTRLEGWAMDARSGAFARLLGSMAAGVAQQRSLLPARGGDR